MEARRKKTLGIGATLLAIAACLALTGPQAAARPVRRLLPNLVPIVPNAFHGPQTNFDISYTFGGGLIVEGCTLDETARKLAGKCLRFDTVLGNPGRGPFEIAYRTDPEHGVIAAHQNIYKSDGSSVSRFATETEYHPTHLHFHIKDIYLARLWRVDAKDRPRGKRPVAQSDKNGFCPEDSTQMYAGPAPRHYSCISTNADVTSGDVQVVGISSGWADIYPYTLPDQYIEISDVKDGRYLFELAIDPHDYFVESSEEDNNGCVLLSLRDNQASLLRTRDCPNRD